MAKAVGIDLGTTNSAVAAWQGGEAAVNPDSAGSRTTPLRQGLRPAPDGTPADKWRAASTRPGPARHRSGDARRAGAAAPALPRWVKESIAGRG
ncbi:Hsp70 family protein [Streptomyces sp. PA03-3a]|nr:Hsp70 family protein [Streptomyces sp. PA03-3a]